MFYFRDLLIHGFLNRRELGLDFILVKEHRQVLQVSWFWGDFWVFYYIGGEKGLSCLVKDSLLTLATMYGGEDCGIMTKFHLTEAKQSAAHYEVRESQEIAHRESRAILGLIIAEKLVNNDAFKSDLHCMETKR